MTQTVSRPDYAAVTDGQRRTWATGDFSVIALAIVPVAEALVQSADPHAGQRVLDVACGNGNTALVLARRYCRVTGLDFVPALLERGRARARAEGTEIRFVEGDAQALPFADGEFDFVFSSFGVMFAPDQARAAAELCRVCRPGGTIALASWIPEGTVSEMFGAVGKNLPQTPGLAPPTRWGTESGLRELFAGRAKSFRCQRRTINEYFLSVNHAIEVFRADFGPIVCAYAALNADQQSELTRDLTRVFGHGNSATDGTLVLPLDYLEALIEVG
jgi:SAM-dependent methyltransferase